MDTMEELKKRVESVLFSSGRKMHLNEIARLVGNIDVDAVKKSLEELKEKYKEDSSLFLAQEGDEWKLTVKERYIPLVHKIVTKTELTKTLMETLAVIAYKAPVLQSEIIKIRTNKAYDHLKELEEAGYISRAKHGRTKMIKLTPKFFEYFDVPPDKLKEKFKNVQQLEKAVEEKESELREKREMITQKKNELKEKDEEHKKKTSEEAGKLQEEIEDLEKSQEIDLIDKKGKKHKLKKYVSERIEKTELEEPEPTMPPYKEKIGELDVYERGMTPGEKKEFVEEAEKERAVEEHEEKEKRAKKARPPSEAEEEAEPEEEYGLLEEEKPPEKEEGVEEIAEEVKKIAKPLEAKEVAPETIEEHARRIAEAKMKGKPIEFKGEKLFAKGIPPDIQAKIDARVKEIIYGEKKKEEKPGEEEKEDEERVEEETGEATEEVKEKEEEKEGEEKPEEETEGLPY